MESSAHLIANKNSYYAKKQEILELYDKLNRVVNNG
jgi:ATP phosphoribosyltransferase